MTDNTSANLFRKKPVVISAVQFTKAMAEGHESLPEGVVMASRTTDATGHFPEYANDGKYLTNYDTCHRHCIATLEGQMDVRIGDWVITGVQGEHYACKPDIFEQTYEAATPAPTMVDERGDAAQELPVPKTDDSVAWVLFWLDSALRCKAFHWDEDQRACAEDALRAATLPTLQSLGGDAGVSDEQILAIGLRHFKKGGQTKLEMDFIAAVREILSIALASVERSRDTYFAERNSARDAYLHHRKESEARGKALALSLTSPEKSDVWLPIEQAPKDGSLFLCWVSAVRYGETEDGQQYQEDASQVDFCNWRTQDDIPDCGWFDPCCGQIGDQQGVTHWMPLPAAPKAAEKSGRSE